MNNVLEEQQTKFQFSLVFSISNLYGYGVDHRFITNLFDIHLTSIEHSVIKHPILLKNSVVQSYLWVQYCPSLPNKGIFQIHDYIFLSKN